MESESMCSKASHSSYPNECKIDSGAIGVTTQGVVGIGIKTVEPGGISSPDLSILVGILPMTHS